MNTLRQEGNQQYKKFVDTKRKEQIYAELQNEHNIVILQWILSRITAWSPMFGTPINHARRPINQGLI